ncbi:hypothetical protein K1T71_005449 [Dendrolimus kikuchii]|uniref:Uncharacterized protein n=1 Tax=Dendrolimus kikuchii TaxID=765133 RepID=A0ACC1D4M2_9NEOP|nr:hypothetical protein K1T71_005449 [Dendrolimus kikuchii]
MYTNPFERKHSALRQVLDRFMRGETRLSFRKKDMSKGSVNGSSSVRLLIRLSGLSGAQTSLFLRKTSFSTINGVTM